MLALTAAPSPRPLRRARPLAGAVPAAAAALSTKAQATAHLRAPTPRSRPGSRRYPRKGRSHEHDLRRRRRLDGEDLVGRRGRDRRRARSTTRPASSPRRGPGRRSPGRWRAATRARSAGTRSTTPRVWLGFCALFLLGLADCGGRSALRNLDLLVLLSFSASLWYFNHGDVFTSVPLAYPPLVYLLVRLHLDRRARPPRRRRRAVWPVWLLSAATVFLVRLPDRAQRQRLERDRRRLLGRHRRRADRARRRRRTGNFPVEGDAARRAARPTAPARSASGSRRTAAASRRTRRATRTGRSPTRRTSPATSFSAGAGSGTTCPRRTSRSIAFDLLCAARARARRAPLRRARGSRPRSRSPGRRIRSRSTSRTRTRTTRSCRASSSGASGSSRHPPRAAPRSRSRAGRSSRRCCVAPLWAVVPRRASDAAREGGSCVGFARRDACVAFSILLLDADPLHAAHVFWTRTVGWQIGRDVAVLALGLAPVPRAGCPTCTSSSACSRCCSSAGAVAAYFLPRRKSPLQLAALTGRAARSASSSC